MYNSQKWEFCLLGPASYLVQTRGFSSYPTNNHLTANIVFPFWRWLLGVSSQFLHIIIWRWVPLDHDRGVTFGPLKGSIFCRNVSKVISFNFLRVKLRMLWDRSNSQSSRWDGHPVISGGKNGLFLILSLLGLRKPRCCHDISKSWATPKVYLRSV